VGTLLRTDTWRLDATELTRLTTGGIRVGARLTRAGVFEYEGGQRRELRPAAEVFRPDSLATLRGAPVTVGHPPMAVTAATWRAEAVGHVGDDVRRDGDFVRASLVIHDEAAAKRVEARELVELSCGYRLDEVEEAPGIAPDGTRYDAVQVGMSYNHVALLAPGEGRAGPQVRIDSAGGPLVGTPACVPPRRPQMIIRIDGLDFELSAEHRTLQQAIERVIARRDELEAEAEKKDEGEGDDALAKMTAERDALRAQLDELQAATKADEAKNATESEAVAKEVADRMDAADGARLIGSTPDLRRSAREIRIDALKARGVSVAGKTDAYIDARFDAAVEAARAAGDSRTALLSAIDSAGAARSDAADDDPQTVYRRAAMAAHRGGIS
jgi:hypothetical protein